MHNVHGSRLAGAKQNRYGVRSVIHLNKSEAAAMPVEMDTPVVAALSAVGEARWGFHQFPNLSRMPDGSILLTWADAADASETHGNPAPALVSDDDGQTWQPYAAQPVPVRPHYSVSKVFDGEYLVMPSSRYLNIQDAGVTMPEPISEADAYGKLYHYRVADLPRPVQDYFHHIPARRWTPGDEQWHDDVVDYDPKGLLAWKRENSDVLPRTFFERTVIPHEGELLYADYRARYALLDGAVTGKGGTHLMASRDNGKSFEYRATVAADRAGNDLYGEPALAPTADGNLICVIRKTDHVQKPMVITTSHDQGHTWSPVRDVTAFGVWPCVLLLGCGTLVVTYGRPGVYLMTDATGTGENWSAPTPVIEGDHNAITHHSCGYTCMLPLDDRSALLAYSGFQHIDADGKQRKVILTRRISV